MYSLNDTKLFLPHLEQIRDYLWQLQQAQDWINV